MSFETMKNLKILCSLIIIISMASAVLGRSTKLIINENVPYSPSNTPSSAPIAAETKNYIDLVSRSRISVDKTFLIESVLDFPWEVMLLTCPGKWGKTTNMLMIRDFFQIVVDDNGVPIPLENSVNYQFYKNAVLPGNRTLKEKLLISRNQTLMDTHLGRFPVIHVSFRNTTGVDKAAFIQSLANSIADAYREHRYLAKVVKNEKSSGARRYCQLIKNFLAMPYSFIEVDQVRLCLHWLSDMLYDYFQREIYVIIDDYDVPINHALLHPNFNREERDEAVEFYHHVLSWVLKDNARIRKSVMTATLKLSRPLIHRTMGYITIHNYLDHRICEYFGINGYDFDSICDYLSIPPQRRTLIDKWFGYRVGPNGTVRIINPYSLAKHLETGIYQDFGQNPSTIMEILIPIFLRNRDFFTKYLQTLSGYAMGVLGSDLTNFDITYETSIANPIYKLKLSFGLEAEDAFKLMLIAGYLGLDHDPKKRAKLTYRGFLLYVANNQMRFRMQKIFENFLEILQKGLKNRLQKLTQHFKTFALNNQSTSRDLETAIHDFFYHLPTYQGGRSGCIEENDTIRVYSNNRDLIHSMPYMITCISQSTEFRLDDCILEIYGTAYQREIFIWNNRAVLYEFKYDNETTVLEETSGFNELDDEPKFLVRLGPGQESVDQAKIVGIHVYKNRTTLVSGELVPLRVDIE